MTVKRELNNIRRSLLQKLTKNIGRSGAAQRIGSTGKAEIKKVLICRPNHRLGNLLLITPLLQEISETFPHAKIDLFVKGGLAPLVFKNFDQVDRIIQLPKKPFSDFLKYVQGWIKIRKNHYDIVINVVNGSSSGKISAQFANAEYKFYGDVDPQISTKYRDHEHMAKYPVYSFRSYISKLGFVENKKEVATLNLKLSPAELTQGKKLLYDLVKNEKKTICLFTFATGTKLYPESWWKELYERLQTEFADCNIIEVLPVENCSQIGFKAPTYAHKDIRVIGSFIASTDVFIGADSGMMHLAGSVQTPTIGLFKVTDPNSYEPYNDKSTAIDTNNTGMEDWIEKVKAILSPY